MTRSASVRTVADALPSQAALAVVLGAKFREEWLRQTGLPVVRADSAEIEHDLETVETPPHRPSPRCSCLALTG